MEHGQLNENGAPTKYSIIKKLCRIWKPTELKVGIFAQRAMVGQARRGLCYQRET